MAGTIPLSMTQQFDPLGDPLSGGLLYFFVAGTVSTPQNAFKDLSLTLPHPNPITLDMAGRVPQLFFADGLIKVRLTDSAGVVQLAVDNVQVIGASSGGGGGGAVDATTIAQTGDIKKRYGVGIHTGWVRCNGRTIGGSLSSATELADPSAQALFIHLWGVDANLAVSGGRGSTGLADWNAGKQMTLPDGRGTLFAGMDDMGGAAANRLTSTYFGANATVLGARGGIESHTLLTAQMPSHVHSGQTNFENQDHTHDFTHVNIAGGGASIQGGSPWQFGNATNATTGPSRQHYHLFGTDPTGGGTAHNNVQPTMVITFYLKL
jgi:microcystin-dependent protein